MASVFAKEMGFTHAGFYRDIERVLGAGNYQETGHGIITVDGDKRLEIDLAKQGERKIALISLPVVHVTFTFDNYGEDDITAFFALYDRIFRRGGG